MSAPVSLVVALGAVAWEAPLVAAFGHPASRIHVVRRCVGLTDLLASASTGMADAAILTAATKPDRDVVARLRASGVLPIGLANDEDEERDLRRVGIDVVIPVDVADLGRVPAAIVTAARGAGPAADPSGYVDVSAFPVRDQLWRPEAGGAANPAGTGRVVAVWGPPGAPGRSSVALALADEAAAAGIPTLLVDADTRAASLGAMVGVLDDGSGLSAAVRRADAGRLDVPALAGIARQVTSGLRLLTGLSRPQRWHELRPAALSALWDVSRAMCPLVVIDIGCELDGDDELLSDGLRARRNAAAVTALDLADLAVTVVAAEPLSLSRLALARDGLTDVWPDLPTSTVVTRVRRSAVGGDPRPQVGAALYDHCGIVDPVYVADDRAAYDTALREARTLREAAPTSQARVDLRDWALSVCQDLGLREGPTMPSSSRWRRGA